MPNNITNTITTTGKSMSSFLVLTYTQLLEKRNVFDLCSTHVRTIPSSTSACKCKWRDEEEKMEMVIFINNSSTVINT